VPTTCLDMVSLIFPGAPSSSEKALVAQAKACGNILSIYPINTNAKSLPDTTGSVPNFMRELSSQDDYQAVENLQTYIFVMLGKAQNLVFSAG